MTDPHRILVAVNDSDTARKTLDYVASILGGLEDAHVHLMHVHRPIPSSLLEHGGAEEPEREMSKDERLRARRRAWEREIEEKETAPLMEEARRILKSAGIPGSAIEMEWRGSIDQMHVARKCIETAREKGCRTIALGRDNQPWYEELFHSHAGDRVVRDAEGLTVWIVE